MTEKPYSRHKWVASGPRPKLIKQGDKQEVITYLRVICKRCGINDPHSPTY